MSDEPRYFPEGSQPNKDDSDNRLLNKICGALYDIYTYGLKTALTLSGVLDVKPENKTVLSQQIVSSTSTYPSIPVDADFDLCNDGTVPVKWSLGNTCTVNVFDGVLNACATTGDGLGGFASFSGRSGVLSFYVASGSPRVSVTIYT